MKFSHILIKLAFHDSDTDANTDTDTDTDSDSDSHDTLYILMSDTRDFLVRKLARMSVSHSTTLTPTSSPTSGVSFSLSQE